MLDGVNGDKVGGLVENEFEYTYDTFLNRVTNVRFLNGTGRKLLDSSSFNKPPPVITSLTILARICSTTPVTMSTGQMQTVINMLDPYVASCSYGKTRMPADGVSNIVIGPINIPCKGYVTDAKYAWSGSTCTGIDYLGWMDYATNYVKTSLGINPDKYDHKILILFGVETLCQWAGMGAVQCTPPGCFVWIQRLSATMIETILHELGHNLGVLHSSTLNDTYGDYSCVMGSCCGARCFSVYPSSKFGWSNPIPGGKMVSPIAGLWTSYVLPGLLASDYNHISVSIPGLNNGIFYMSFRTPFGFDANLMQYLQNKVYVHYLTIKDENTLQRPFRYAILAQGEKYIDSASTLVFKADTIIPNINAYISFCLPTGPYEICGDGLDNDCNGLIDSYDPACYGVNPSPSPPPPPPPTVTPYCGDGICNGNENVSNCVVDCHFCGDKICTWPYETSINCPIDCSPSPPPPPSPTPNSPPPPPPPTTDTCYCCCQ